MQSLTLITLSFLSLFISNIAGHIPATYSPFKVLLDVHGYNFSNPPDEIGSPAFFRSVHGRRVYGLQDTSLVCKTLESAYHIDCETRDRGSFYVCNKDVPELRKSYMTRVALVCYWDRTELRPPEGYGLKLCMDPVIVARYSNDSSCPSAI